MSFALDSDQGDAMHFIIDGFAVNKAPQAAMKNALILTAALVLSLANGLGEVKALTKDVLTGMPVIPARDSEAGRNTPEKMPDGHICKSRMQGNFYSLYDFFSAHNVTLNEVIAWYSSHLSGFKKIQGHEFKSSQTAFYNSDGSLVILVTAESGPQSESTKAHGVAYELYQPGLSEKTITGLTQGKIVCE
jgi:hypothetical protein